eukprot:scaffold3553_cov137-Isochrysis_galbana.AAC.3
MEVMKGGPRIPTKVSIMIVKVGEKEAVEVSEVIVDPLLPRLDVVGEVARQSLQRVDVARRANLGACALSCRIYRGGPRSARRLIHHTPFFLTSS